MQHSRILIVEDSATQAEALRSLLVEHCDAVDVARSGEEALERLEEAPADLVLSDIMMPGISGYDLTRRIKSHPTLSRIPVVLLTSLGDPLDIVRGLECGADNYVTKPYDPDSLLARVRHVLTQRRLRREPRASMGVNVSFLGTSFTISSDREQILDLFISSVEDVVRTNHALQESQRELAEAQQQLERFARQMAHRAHASAERSAHLMQQASDAILVIDGEHRIMESNARASELLGRAPSELLKQRLDAFVQPGDAPALAACIATSGARAESRDVVFVHPQRGATYCEVAVSSAGSEADAPRLVILHDVTERRASEVALRRAVSTLEAVIQASPPAIVAVDGDDRVTLWNPAAERLFGWRAGEVLGRPNPIVPSDGDAADASRRLTMGRGANPEPLEAKCRRADGSVVDVLLSTAPLRDDAGHAEGVLSVIQDIGDRKRAESALAESEARLRQSQKMEAVGRLAGGVAHDFNNLITAITGYVHLLLADLPTDSPMRGDLAEIDKAAARAAALTGQLLAFSRKQVLKPRVLDLNGVVDGMKALMRRLIVESVVLEVSLAPAVGPVEADAGQLEQVLMNLIVNAADAMPGGGRLRIETADVDVETPLAYGHGVLGAGRYVRLRVADTGEGMTDETLSHIFEPFFTTKQVGKGTGLGLSTVFGIVQQSGGHVAVSSRRGAGTTFDVYLPRVDAPAVSDEGAARREAAPPGSGTLLLVEDEPAVRASVAKALQRQGYQVVGAPDAESGLALIESRAEPFDLVITDAVMPGMGGAELVQRLRRTHPALPVLVVSGYTDQAFAGPLLAERNVRMLNKPFTPLELQRTIRDILDEARRGDAPGGGGQ